ncbi:hypothetical protein [Sporosalibacterium faouarense]|uniref:hypothetical protein n=1 Tax=Sporosalibacterium faouarense TaxID=516123 RepID=UPI00141D32C7|nr:hypothetical protein [Sporosalibacterium faouarense]MTI48588.1 hypothetical protein [Bacillota bacterium]
MTGESNQENKVSFFRSKHFFKVVIVSIIILLIFVTLSLFADTQEARVKIVSDNLFAVSLLILIFAVFARSRAWSLFKKSLKTNDEEVLEKSKKTKYLSKALTFIGFFNLLGSIIALFLIL